MVARIIILLLYVLLGSSLSLPAWAHVLPETRVWGSLEFSLLSHHKTTSQLIGTHRDNCPSNYDFAPGLHKYLYCQGNPVNFSDPSGHEGLGGFIVNMSLRIGMAAMRLPGIAAAQITGMSTIGKIGMLATAAYIMGKYEYNEFAGDAPTTEQSKKIQKAASLIKSDGFGALATRIDSLRFRVVDILHTIDAYGFAPYFAIRTVWLDPVIFSWDDISFAAILIHETQHTMHMITSEKKSYQIESDFLWAEHLSGSVDSVSKQLPNTSHNWAVVTADQMRETRINRPAITP